MEALKDKVKEEDDDDDNDDGGGGGMYGTKIETSSDVYIQYKTGCLIQGYNIFVFHLLIQYHLQ